VRTERVPEDMHPDVRQVRSTGGPLHVGLHLVLVRGVPSSPQFSVDS
jgi:hypothetical protein